MAALATGARDSDATWSKAVEDAQPVILVVDDEPITRLYECDVAEEAGYLTVGAFSAEDAILELEGPTQFQVMLTDVEMPGGLDGFALARTVQERWPEVKIVITSGEPDYADQAEESDLTFVAKPFTPDQLTSALQSGGPDDS